MSENSSQDEREEKSDTGPIQQEQEGESVARRRRSAVSQKTSEPQKMEIDLDQGQGQPEAEEEIPNRPNRYTLYKESFDFSWNMQNFDVQKAVKEFSELKIYPELEDSEDEEGEEGKGKKSKKQINAKIYETAPSKKLLYKIKGADKNGEFQISRMFKEFVALKEKLVARWPGCFIPPIQTKKIGKTEDVIASRTKILNNFLKKISDIPEVYYGEECAIFFKHQTEHEQNSIGKLVESELQHLPHQSNEQLLQKYKKNFANSIEDLTEQEQNIAISEIKELQLNLNKFKGDLSDCKEQVRSLAQAKERYYNAMTKLNRTLLPQYEEIVLEWVNYSEGRLTDKTKDEGQEGEGNIEHEQLNSGYLLNTQQYGNALQDTALSVKNYNDSLWILYDIFKFQLKETDSILHAIQSYEYLVREKEYLSRNIFNNQQQILSLDEKKTTLKIFFMGGDTETKKEKISKQSDEFENKLKTVNELLNYVLNVLINAIEQFHNDRLEAYKRILGKSCQSEMIIVKKLMDFHLFELDLFKLKKERD